MGVEREKIKACEKWGVVSSFPKLQKVNSATFVLGSQSYIEG